MTATWGDGGKVLFSVPSQRLPEVRNDKYFADFFPGCECPGLVAGVEGESPRRLTPAYFFRLPMPERFFGDPAVLKRDGRPTTRALARPDPLGQSIYILYHPSHEKPGGSVTIEFGAPARRPSQ